MRPQGITNTVSDGLNGNRCPLASVLQLAKNLNYVSFLFTPT